MPHLIRPLAPGPTIFFEVSLRDESSDLLTREINLLRFSVAKTLKDLPVQVNAWTVLPSHMMCIWTMPEGDADYATRWQLIKSRFSKSLPAELSGADGSETAVWKRSVWEHQIRGPFDYQTHLKRCYTAPADLGLVTDPDLWRFSSFFKARQAARRVA